MSYFPYRTALLQKRWDALTLGGQRALTSGVTLSHGAETVYG